MKTENVGIRAAMDRRLSFLRADSGRRESIRRLTAEGARSHYSHDGIGGRKMKKKLRVGFAAALVLAILSFSALAAGITGIFSGINWLGEMLPQETPDMPDVTPAPFTEADARTRFDQEQEILNSRPDRELVVIREEKAGSWAPRKQEAGSLEEVRNLTLASSLPFPGELPEGYRFADGRVYLSCRPEGEFVLTDCETHPAGFSVERYSVDASMDFVSGYALRFHGLEEGDFITVDVWMDMPEDASGYFISVNPGQRAEAVRVEGMDNAVAVSTPETCILAMRRALSEPVPYLYFTGNGQNTVEIYGEVRVDVSASRLDASDLADIFSAD